MTAPLVASWSAGPRPSIEMPTDPARMSQTRRMGRTERQTTRRGAARLVGRWLLIGWVLTGVVAMHVLAQHDPGGGHGMLMDPHAAVSSTYTEPMSMVGQGHHPTAVPAAVAAVVMAPVASGLRTPSGSDMGGAMAGCILFLTAAIASVVVLLLLASRRNSEGLSSFRSTWWQSLLRGPPGPRPPRISLCVLRV
jgi:hypothetical protein